MVLGYNFKRVVNELGADAFSGVLPAKAAVRGDWRVILPREPCFPVIRHGFGVEMLCEMVRCGQLTTSSLPWR